MRSFVAVEVSSNAIAKLQKEILSTTGWNARDVKPVEPHNFHFTIIFHLQSPTPELEPFPSLHTPG
jgi:2'-5' RNA ligase